MLSTDLPEGPALQFSQKHSINNYTARHVIDYVTRCDVTVIIIVYQADLWMVEWQTY